MMNIGHSIAKIRINHGLTQRELAEALHISSGTIGNYESNNRIPPIEKLIDIAKLFNVTVDELLRDDYDASSIVALPSPEAPIAQITLSATESKILKTFRQLNEDNQDIVIGEAKKLLREQQIEEKGETAEKSAI